MSNPDRIMADEFRCTPESLRDNPSYVAMAKTLIAWKKSGREWDEYRRKVDGLLLLSMAKIFRQSRESGFYYGGARELRSGFRIWFYQAVEPPRKKPMPELLKSDPCSFCEKICIRENNRGEVMKDTNGDELPHCWK